MKTVMITGSNGNLGTAVTKEFLDKNYRVIATVDHEAARADMPTHPNLDVEVVNLMQEKETNDFVQHCIEKYRTIDAAHPAGRADLRWATWRLLPEKTSADRLP